MEGHLSGYGGNTNASEVFMANDFDLELQTTHMEFSEPNVPSQVNTEEIEEIDGEQFATGAANKKGFSHRGKAFLPQEDRVIVSGWLNISTDACTGASQTSNAFYARLHKYFLENWDIGSNRTQVSIQNRWTTIRKAVSKFTAIHSAIQRRNESGKNDLDKVKDAIIVYEQTKPWQFAHCWEIMREEPKWNNYLLECNKPKQPVNKDNQPAPALETPATRAQIERPEGRDSVKKRRAAVEESSSSVAVEMLQKIHNRGQQLDEQEAKQKEELIAIERAKFDLQQKALLAKIEQGEKKIELQREISCDQREVSLEQIKLQRDIMETNRFQTEAQIMFTDLNSFCPSVRFWIAKK
ncbi:hypothetical protein GQ55_1G230300 [Panicum hallii var. hallii]|uniref:No apical meristem-associated C-terminal domain-containing protein n=1 Tax=Panicum hallii var. hallii TaxID=1504633 RepID=A0A2T7F6N0_9POAL|nr:hypothetical protein GQ55_1G230300 [Panicum hallii var. hallii]